MRPAVHVDTCAPKSVSKTERKCKTLFSCCSSTMDFQKQTERGSRHRVRELCFAETITRKRWKGGRNRIENNRTETRIRGDISMHTRIHSYMYTFYGCECAILRFVFVIYSRKCPVHFQIDAPNPLTVTEAHFSLSVWVLFHSCFLLFILNRRWRFSLNCHLVTSKA